MLRLAFIAILCASAACSAHAADISVAVADQDGKPARDAVVSLRLAEDGRSVPASAAQKHVIDQTNEAFVPFVTAMRRGDQVQFTNSDRTRHHVYSFSPAKQFELILNPGEKSQALKFDQAGVAAIGCNIHDKMLAYAYVTETPWFAITDAQGRATIKDVPKGKYRASAWHPRMESDSVVADQSVDSENAAVKFELRLMPARSGHGHQRHY
jgi:plastocyanin